MIAVGCHLQIGEFEVLITFNAFEQFLVIHGENLSCCWGQR